MDVPRESAPPQDVDDRSENRHAEAHYRTESDNLPEENHVGPEPASISVVPEQAGWDDQQGSLSPQSLVGAVAVR